MSDVTVRRARMDDATAAAALVTSLGYPTTPAEMTERFVHLLVDPIYVALVAEDDGQVIGLSGGRVSRYFEKNGLYAQIVILVVADSAHNKGAGTALVEAVEQWAREQNALDIVVNSGVHRNEAHRFYERRGFERTGFRFRKSLAATTR